MTAKGVTWEEQQRFHADLRASGVHVDNRIGGCPRYSFPGSRGCEPLMMVPDDIRKCVAFIGCASKDAFEYRGSCFFVARESKAGLMKGRMCSFAVTAKHVIDGIAQDHHNSVLIRLNTKLGAYWYQTPTKDWLTHPADSTIDVSVLRNVTLKPDAFDHQFFPLSGSIGPTDKKGPGHRLGIGDELFLTGLFYQHAGNKRNIPIIRVGHLAAMNEEPVTASLGKDYYRDIDAYLIEGRSIGGLSGSPVFVYYEDYVREGGRMLGEDPQIYLMGMMQGHYDEKGRKKDQATADDITRERVNMGIGIVVPITRVREVIDQPDIAELERQEETRALSESGPVADGSQE